jgi:peptide/nickel transport system substrate-binding protein
MTKRPFPFILFIPLLLALMACADAAGQSLPTVLEQIATEEAREAELATQTAVVSARPEREQTLRILYWQAPVILNPHLATGVKDWAAGRVVYEPLATYDKDANLVPILAAEIPSLENGGLAADFRSITWSLQPGLRWSDGEPVTAADILFTYEFVTNPAVAATSRSNYTAIDQVEVLDDHTVRLHFRDVNPAWSVPFVGVQGVILPRHIFEPYANENARQAPANWQSVGTGPYRVVENGFRYEEVLLLGSELVETTRIIFEANPFFRELDKPFFNRVELRGGGTAREAARLVLQTGEIDYAWNLQLDQAELDFFTAGTPTGEVIASLQPTVERILLNRTDPNRATATGERASLAFPHPFFGDDDPDNQLVRQAISLAVDREAIIRLYPGSQLTPNLLVAPDQYNSPHTSFAYDLEQAAALLDAAGWVDSTGDGIRDKDGVSMRLVYITTINPVRQETQRIVQEALEELGISVQIVPIDATNFFNRNPANENSNFHFYADMQQLFTGNTSPNPDAYMQQWTCTSIPQQSNNWAGFNRERWCNDIYDQLYQAAIAETDLEQRRQLFIQMNDLIIENVVTIPLVHRAQLAGVGHDLVGVDLTPWDADLWNIKDWRRAP